MFLFSLLHSAPQYTHENWCLLHHIAQRSMISEIFYIIFQNCMLCTSNESQKSLKIKSFIFNKKKNWYPKSRVLFMRILCYTCSFLSPIYTNEFKIALRKRTPLIIYWIFKKEEDNNNTIHLVVVLLWFWGSSNGREDIKNIGFFFFVVCGMLKQKEEDAYAVYIQ